MSCAVYFFETECMRNLLFVLFHFEVGLMIRASRTFVSEIYLSFDESFWATKRHLQNRPRRSCEKLVASRIELLPTIEHIGLWCIHVKHII